MRYPNAWTKFKTAVAAFRMNSNANDAKLNNWWRYMSNAPNAVTKAGWAGGPLPVKSRDSVWHYLKKVYKKHGNGPGEDVNAPPPAIGITKDVTG